jgi:NAD(P)H-nitrite reductase large subunit
MNNNPSQKQDVICTCSGTTKAQIQNLIAKGIYTFEEIAVQTGAGTGCGSCDYLIDELIAEEKPIGTGVQT